MVKKKRIYANYDEFLKERLKNPKLARAYLNEALKDEDQNVFLIALKDVLQAQEEDASAIAKKAHISRQSFYRMLSKKGNPRWNNITSLIDAMGLQVQVRFK
jgi:probable addiction module antidote protein